ncbi:MAG: TIGR03032 family protein [Rhodospirillales bacterium]|nr:TIGR03032 family protein [Rhodospirillales bacterium]
MTTQLAATADHPAPAAALPVPQFRFLASRQLTAFMAEHKLSLGFTTYQAGLMFLVGLQDNGRFHFANRSFPRCMGLWCDGEQMWMSSLYQLWNFRNVLAPGETRGGYDRLFVPRVAYTTGDLDIHDIGVDAGGRAVFVNTLYSCLARPSDAHSFVPLWKPPFISKIAAEDRCHLNGMAMADGRPRYASAICRSDAASGWRDRREDGGCLVDIDADRLLTTGLSMPHSPRLWRDRLFVLESGTGWFGEVNRATGAFQRMTFCPGYLRGLAFHKDFAIAGLSKPRRDMAFSGLALDRALAERDVDARCGIVIIDLASGDLVHWLHIEGDIGELYDVVALPDCQRPMPLGVLTDEVRRAITIGEPAALSPGP